MAHNGPSRARTQRFNEVTSQSQCSSSYTEGSDGFPHNPRSSSVHQPSTSCNDRRRRSRSRSHTRSKSEQVLPSSDPCAPAIPVIPLRWRQQRPAPIPNAIPPGYPAGTTWVLDSGGWPQLKVPESLTGHVNASPHTAIRDREQRQSQFCPPIDHSRHLGPIAHHEDSNRLSRANLTNAYDLPRRSRSQSRSRSDQVAPLFDVTAPPVPSIPPRTGRQQKQFLIPDAIPPGYPDGTRWIVGSSGWPQLETPDQFRERYGISSPAVAPARESPYKHGRDPHAPVIASPSPQKPMFKRIFGGILGGNKRAGTPGPTQAPPANQVPNASPSSSRTNPRSRTKSF